jgi:hypothetical protein
MQGAWNVPQTAIFVANKDRMWDVLAIFARKEAE